MLSNHNADSSWDVHTILCTMMKEKRKRETIKKYIEGKEFTRNPLLKWNVSLSASICSKCVCHCLLCLKGLPELLSNSDALAALRETVFLA